MTEAIALDDDKFWALIELIPDSPSADDFNELSSQLAGCAFDDIIAFDARLTLALHALDSPAAADWLEANDPSGFGFVSDDVFLYARCASVLGGRDSWEAAVSEHTVDWGSDSPDREGMSEYLLYVGADAAAAQGIGFEEFYDVSFSRIPLSYETGSNTEFWD